jgi:hypothetical protein
LKVESLTLKKEGRDLNAGTRSAEREEGRGESDGREYEESMGDGSMDLDYCQGNSTIILSFE